MAPTPKAQEGRSVPGSLLRLEVSFPHTTLRAVTLDNAKFRGVKKKCRPMNVSAFLGGKTTEHDYDVTIQMKALCLYLHMVYLFFKILQNEICKSSRNLPLATFGSERVKTSNDIYAIR